MSLQRFRLKGCGHFCGKHARQVFSHADISEIAIYKGGEAQPAVTKGIGDIARLRWSLTGGRCGFFLGAGRRLSIGYSEPDYAAKKYNAYAEK